jgi:hypothetical protein
VQNPPRDRTRLNFRHMSRARATGYGCLTRRGQAAARAAVRGAGLTPTSVVSRPSSSRQAERSALRGGKGRRRTLRPSSFPYACGVLLFWPFVAFRCVIRWFAGLRPSTISRRENWNAAEEDRGRDRRPGRRCCVKTLRSAGGTTTTLPRIQKCSCDGSGWFVSLNRDRYRSPGDAGMVRVTRCLCLEHAPSPARRGGAGAV